MKGLFGLDADYPNKIVYIHPSLRHSGSISCRLGVHRFDMNVDVDNIHNKRKIIVNTSYCGQGNFRVLINEESVAKIIKDGESELQGALLTLWGKGPTCLSRPI